MPFSPTDENIVEDTESLNESARPTPFGTFEMLPKEIRDIIYIPLLANGSTALTRTSKAIYTDTREILYRHGVYRVYFKDDGLQRTGIYTYRRHLEWKSPKCLAKAQNLYIRITLSTHKTLGSLIKNGTLAQILPEIVNAMDRTVECNVNLEFDRQMMVTLHTMTGMAELRCFRTVTVVLSHPLCQSSQSLWFTSKGFLPMKDICDQATRALERFLGPTKGMKRGLI